MEGQGAETGETLHTPPRGPREGATLKCVLNVENVLTKIQARSFLGFFFFLKHLIPCLDVKVSSDIVRRIQVIQGATVLFNVKSVFGLQKNGIF